MKILLVGEHYFDTPIYSLNKLLGSLGHDVRIFDPARNSGLPAWFIRGRHARRVSALWSTFLHASMGDPDAVANRRLMEAVAGWQPDLVFIISLQLVLPETIDAIKSSSDAKVVGWFMDAVTSFGRGYFLPANYDALFFVDPYIVELFHTKLENERVYLLPICCDPELHKPVELTPAEQQDYGCDLTVAANLYYYRAQVLAPFVDYDMKIWGAKPRWLSHPINRKFTGRVVLGEEKSKAMRAAKIVLNNNHYANISGVNKRTFEMAGIGAFQITDAPGVTDVFEKDVEIVTFDTRRDLKEKVDYYLAHPSERMEIAERAQRRAHAEHTFARRWQEILKILARNGHALPAPAEREDVSSSLV
jgi:spore maturation protein CgeB